MIYACVLVGVPLLVGFGCLLVAKILGHRERRIA